MSHVTFHSDISNRYIMMIINIDLKENEVTGGSSASERNFSPLVTMSASLSNMIKLHTEQDGQ